MKQSDKGKVKWYLLLFLAVSLFLTAMATQQIALNFVVIGLALVIYKFGSPVLFGEYEEKRKQKLADSLAVREAAKEVLNSGELFKKK